MSILYISTQEKIHRNNISTVLNILNYLEITRVIPIFVLIV